MIWAKTEAGRVEMQAKALIKERSQRSLLLLIDGQKSEEMLLANMVGIKPQDFTALQLMGLIEPLAARTAARPAAAGAAAATPVPTGPAVDAPVVVPAAALDYAHFTQTLTQLIADQLGLRGFTLTLALEKAGTTEELMEVANRAIEQIKDRKGPAAADAARQALFGR